MKILIIGSKGFIGSFLSNNLSEKFEVWCCDTINSNEANYFKVSKEYPDYYSIVKTEKFDLCVNCSGSANVQNSIIYPNNDFKLNVGNLSILTEAIIKENINCKLINISSAAVYGNPKAFPISVNDHVNPISPYGIHKLLSEKLLEGYFKVFGLSCCSVRIFSAYGNGQKKLFLWDCFQKLMNSNNFQKVSFYGTGNESRDYIHITDIAKQIELVINNAVFDGGVYNIANGEEIFIKDVVGLMQKAMNNGAAITFTGDTRPGDPNNWQADISPMLSWGYKKSVSIEEGINQYVKWAQENA